MLALIAHTEILRAQKTILTLIIDGATPRYLFANTQIGATARFLTGRILGALSISVTTIRLTLINAAAADAGGLSTRVAVSLTIVRALATSRNGCVYAAQSRTNATVNGAHVIVVALGGLFAAICFCLKGTLTAGTLPLKTRRSTHTIAIFRTAIGRPQVIAVTSHAQVVGAGRLIRTLRVAAAATLKGLIIAPPLFALVGRAGHAVIAILIRRTTPQDVHGMASAINALLLRTSIPVLTVTIERAASQNVQGRTKPRLAQVQSAEIAVVAITATSTTTIRPTVRAITLWNTARITLHLERIANGTAVFLFLNHDVIEVSRLRIEVQIQTHRLARAGVTRAV
jgi:hypothetical protein